MGKLKGQLLQFLEKQFLAGLSPRSHLLNPELSLGSLSPPVQHRALPSILHGPSQLIFLHLFGLQYLLKVAVHFNVFRFGVRGNTMKHLVEKGAFLTELAFSSLPKPASPDAPGELVRY